VVTFRGAGQVGAKDAADQIVAQRIVKALTAKAVWSKQQATRRLAATENMGVRPESPS